MSENSLHITRCPCTCTMLPLMVSFCYSHFYQMSSILRTVSQSLSKLWSASFKKNAFTLGHSVSHGLVLRLSLSISSMQSNIICTTKIDLIVGNLQAPYILYESFNFISNLLFIVRCTSTNLSHVHWSELRLRQVFVLGSAPLLSCVLRCLT